MSLDQIREILHGSASNAYSTVVDYLPEFLQNRHHFTPFMLGAIGGVGLSYLAQLSSRKIDTIIPGFDEHVFPLVETYGRKAAIAAPVLYAFMAPEQFETLLTQHSMYASGIAGGLAGGWVVSGQDLSKRSQPKTTRMEFKRTVRRAEHSSLYPPTEES